MVLSGAVVGTTSELAEAPTAASLLTSPMIGDCVDDTFNIAGSGGFGSPIICGDNTGYHMFLDSNPSSTECHTLNFNIGGKTTTTRSWEIYVTQYGCDQRDEAGPDGCLQYYSQTANTIQNFAFPPTATAVTAAVTHLSNQNYDICIRRASGFCTICYGPKILSNPVASAAATGDVKTAQKSFGLSLSNAAASLSGLVGDLCTADYIEIPGATTAAISVITAPANPLTLANRICGRAFGPSTITTAGPIVTAATYTVCTRHLPFRIGVHFDAGELNSAAAASMYDDNEFAGAPGGIVGFKLEYWQVAC